MHPDRYRSKWPRAYSHRAKVEAKAKNIKIQLNPEEYRLVVVA